MRKPNLQCANAYLTRDKEWMYEKYITENLSISKIAKLIPCDYKTIRTSLIRLEIPLKPKHITYGDITYPSRKGEKSSTWKGGNNKCIDCNKLLATRKAIRCVKCLGIFKRKPKQDHADNFIRHSADYKDWRNMVFIRDAYKCQVCGVNSNNLKAHHLDGFGIAPHKRFDVTNGVTLCDNHHLQFHKEYGFGGNTKEQFDEFIAKIEV